jgi:hypothetical protein
MQTSILLVILTKCKLCNVILITFYYRYDFFADYMKYEPDFFLYPPPAPSVPPASHIVMSIVFLENCPNSTFETRPGLIIMSQDHLCNPDVIDAYFLTTRLLAESLLTQWLGHTLAPKHVFDTWLLSGLVRYISGLYLRSRFGINEWKLSIKRDMARVATLDVDEPPLYPLDCDPATGMESINPRRLAKGYYGIGYGEMNDCLRAEFLVLKVYSVY